MKSRQCARKEVLQCKSFGILCWRHRLAKPGHGLNSTVSCWLSRCIEKGQFSAQNGLMRDAE